MKEKVVNKVILLIKNNTDIYSDKDIDKIKYGIEGLYLMITKLIIIFSIAYLFNIINETFLLFIIFSGLRFFGFGVHAKTSMQCLIYSLLLFIFLPLIINHINLSFWKESIIFILCFIDLLIFAPSDTENRRFRKRNKYLIRKICTLIVSLIYIFLYYYFNNSIFLTSIIIQSIVVNPITYKIMGINYNYKILGLNRNI